MCTDCNPGKYTSLPEAGICINCEGGYVNNMPRATSCNKCERGKVSPIEGGTVCFACPSGQYSPAAGLAKCIPCEPGRWNDDAEGAFGCYICPDPAWCLGGSTCTSDRNGFVCSKCAKGWFSVNGNKCQECPESSLGQWLFLTGVVFLALNVLETALNESTSYELENKKKDEEDKGKKSDVHVKRSRSMSLINKIRGQNKATAIIAARKLVATLSVMTTHLITMGFTFPSLDLIHLPKVIRDWIADFLKLIMIDLTSFMSSPECEWKANPLEKYIIKMTLPVIFVFTFTVWNLCHKARYAFCSYCIHYFKTILLRSILAEQSKLKVHENIKPGDNGTNYSYSFTNISNIVEVCECMNETGNEMNYTFSNMSNIIDGRHRRFALNLSNTDVSSLVYNISYVSNSSCQSYLVNKSATLWFSPMAMNSSSTNITSLLHNVNHANGFAIKNVTGKRLGKDLFAAKLPNDSTCKIHFINESAIFLIDTKNFSYYNSMLAANESTGNDTTLYLPKLGTNDAITIKDITADMLAKKWPVESTLFALMTLIGVGIFVIAISVFIKDAIKGWLTYCFKMRHVKQKAKKIKREKSRERYTEKLRHKVRSGVKVAPITRNTSLTSSLFNQGKKDQKILKAKLNSTRHASNLRLKRRQNDRKNKASSNFKNSTRSRSFVTNTVTTYQQNADAFKDALMEKQVVNKMKTKVRLQERAKKTQGTEQAKDDCAKVQKLKDQANDFSWD
eukprot:g10076.t1